MGSSRFARNPNRWAATPKFRYEFHRKLNEKVQEIREDFGRYAGNRIDERTRTGVIAGVTEDIELYEKDSSMLRLSTVFPLPRRLVQRFVDDMDRVFLVEGTHPLIRLQLRGAEKVIAEPARISPERRKQDEAIYGFSAVRDWLGPGSSLNPAHGIVKTDPSRKVLAITVEDFFFHSGMAGLVNTLYNGASFLPLILTNEWEARIVSVLEGAWFQNYHRTATSLPEGVAALLGERETNWYLTDADGIARKAGMNQAANMAVLGSLSSVAEDLLSVEHMEAMIRKKMAQKVREKNVEMFYAGYRDGQSRGV